MELTELIAEVLGIADSRVNEFARPGELENWDSLRHLNLIMRLEETYGVSFDYADLTKLTSVADIRAVLHDKGAGTALARSVD